MSTYTKKMDSFTAKLNKAVSLIPLDTLGVGLECDVGISSDDMAARFKMIAQANVQEIDIWKVKRDNNNNDCYFPILIELL